MEAPACAPGLAAVPVNPAATNFYSELRLRWSLPCTFIRLERPDNVLHLLLKLGVVALPAGEVGGQAAADLGTIAALPAVGEDAAIQIQWDQRTYLLAALFR